MASLQSFRLLDFAVESGKFDALPESHLHNGHYHAEFCWQLRPTLQRTIASNFLSIGTLGFGMGGLTLPSLLRADEANGKPNSHKGLINIFLGGGPPHQDMWEIKTEAPSEIRGEFSPIATNVPGIQICEVFPKFLRNGWTKQPSSVLWSVAKTDMNRPNA